MFVSVFFFVAAWLLVVLTTPLLIRAAEATGFGLDGRNDFRKTHEGRICRLGGLPVFLAVAAASVAIYLRQGFADPEQVPALVGITLMFGLGLWDDLRPLGAKVKLTGQIFIAVLAVALGLQIDSVTYPGGGFAIQLGAGGLLLTVLWLIAVPNIINLIDGIDGLAGGIGMFLALTLGVVALISHQWPVAMVSFALAGALLGFLHFNFPPARIFLGDGGAYLIGFMVAALSVQSENKGSVAAALLVTFIALGLPILDTTLAIIRRAIQGFPLMHADRGHIHHRLHKLGLSKQRVLLSLYAVCVALSLIGLSVFWSQGRTLPIAAGVLVMLALLALRYLGYVGTMTGLAERVRYGLLRRRDVQYALLQSRVLAMEVERCDRPETFWKLFFDTLGRMDLHRKPLPGETMLEVLLHAGENEGALIYVDADRHSHDYAERIVALFARPFALACRRWPEAAPHLPADKASETGTLKQGTLEAASPTR